MQRRGFPLPFLLLACGSRATAGHVSDDAATGIDARRDSRDVSAGDAGTSPSPKGICVTEAGRVDETGVDATRHEAGGPSYGESCKAGACAEGLACDSPSGTCLGGYGADCTLGSGLYCALPNYVCSGDPAQTCQVICGFSCSDEEACGGGYVCDPTDHICSSPPGGPCSDGYCTKCVSSSTCVNGICSALVNCTPDGSCSAFCADNCGNPCTGGSCVCEPDGSCSASCTDNCGNPCSCGCQPDCSGNNCGDDGCGGSCGVCDSNTTCRLGLCTDTTDCFAEDCYGGNAAGGCCASAAFCVVAPGQANSSCQTSCGVSGQGCRGPGDCCAPLSCTVDVCQQ
jgi:hypothetical protein